MNNEQEDKQSKIDVSRPVAEMERLLRTCPSRERREEVIALLRCWQQDEILDDASRRKARMLVRTYAPAFGTCADISGGM